jgi:hypothetical protein
MQNTVEKSSKQPEAGLPCDIIRRVLNHRNSARKRGRVVDCTGLENRQRATVREFESHRFRQRFVPELAAMTSP